MKFKLHLKNWLRGHDAWVGRDLPLPDMRTQDGRL